MKRPLRIVLLAGWLALVVALGAYVQNRLVVSADLRLFLPSPETREQKLLLEEIGQGPASSLLLVGLSGDDPERLAEISQSMVANLQGSRDFTLVANGGAGLESIPERLLPYRYLLTASFDASPLDAATLRAALASRLKDLASPAGAMLEPWIGRDPTLEALKVARAWQPETEPQRIYDVWFTKSGKEALLLAETVAGGFDPGSQETAMAELQHAFVAAKGRSAARMSVTGAGAFSVMMKERTWREAMVIGVVDTIAMLVLLIAAYRSASSVLLGSLPLASGAIAGLAAVSAMFGAVHGITLAFGATLIGVAQDYPIHLLSHQHRGIDPLDNARLIWPTLVTGVASTCIAYLAFLFSGVNGLAQLAVFAIAGLAIAAITTRLLLPRLVPTNTRDCAASPFVARTWAAFDSLPTPRWFAAALAAACIAVIVLAPGPMWEDNLGALTPVPRAVLQEDARLRTELGAPDMRYLLVLTGHSPEELLTRCEHMAPDLDRLVQRGAVAGYMQPAQFLPTAAIQAARRDRLPNETELRSMLQSATAGTPFRPGIFEPFVADVARARALPPLTPERLANTPLAARVGSLLHQRGDHWTALVTLRGVRDPDALARLAGSKGRDVTLLDLRAASDSLVAKQRDRILFSLAIAAVLLAAVVRLSLRDNARTGRVLLPMALTTLLILALLRGAGISLTLFHLIALVLAAGLGLDYALFFEHAADDPLEQRRTLHAVIVCSVSTFVVFATLASSSIPVLHGIGLTVTLGVAANFVLALLLTRLGRRSRHAGA